MGKPKPKVQPPSRVDSLAFPVFGLTWHGAPSSPSNADGCSVVAYCGGGGSAKTGVGNKIVVTVTVDEIPNSAQSTTVAGSGGNGDSDSGGDVTPHLQQQ